MSLSVIFAPYKQFDKDYNLCVLLESRNWPYGDDEFDKMIKKGLANEYQRIYGKSSVKLIGYDYKQYNLNEWSYYPVQLVVKSKPEGNIWIKWRCKNANEYFIVNDIRNLT